MPTTNTDGTIFADSFEATIALQTYVVNSLELSTPNVAVERNDAKGRLAAKKIELDEGRMSGTAELQIDSSAKNVQLWGEEFTVPADYNSTGSDITVVIEEETNNVAANETRTRSVTIRKKLN